VDQAKFPGEEDTELTAEERDEDLSQSLVDKVCYLARLSQVVGYDDKDRLMKKRLRRQKLRRRNQQMRRTEEADIPVKLESPSDSDTSSEEEFKQEEPSEESCEDEDYDDDDFEVAMS